MCETIHMQMCAANVHSRKSNSFSYERFSLLGRFNIAENSKGCHLSKHLKTQMAIPSSESPNKKRVSTRVIPNLFESMHVTRVLSVSSCIIYKFLFVLCVMSQILRYDWLPERGRKGTVARSELAVLSLKKMVLCVPDSTSLLTKLVRSSWPNIGLVLSLCLHSYQLCLNLY